MAYNGSGTFNLASGNPVVTGTTISSTWANSTLSDIATGLSNVICKDGQSTPTANLPMGNYILTGLGTPSSTGDSLAWGKAANVTTLTASSTVTLSGGTANGVLYLNGSKAVTSGSALTFDGTNLAVVGSSSGTAGGAFSAVRNGAAYVIALGNRSALLGGAYDATPNIYYQSSTLAFYDANAGSEQMRLTSTGLGIGTSSPATKLDVNGAAIIRGTLTPTDALKFGANTSAPSADAFIYRPADNTLGFGTASAEKMRLDSSGNVGIGTSSPVSISNYTIQTLNNQSAGSGTYYQQAGTSIGRVLVTSSEMYVGSNSSVPLLFTTAATERARIDSSGNWLVGTTSTISGARVGILNVNAGQAGLGIGNTGGSSLTTTISFRNSNGEVGTIQTSGTATVYNIASDQRLKTNVQPAGSAIQSILDFPVDQFDWIADGSHQDFGAVAQKVQPIIPEMVSVPADEEEMWGIDWSKAVPRLIKTIQEQQAIIMDLKAELDELKSQIGAK